jgi:hypothetical protein
MRGSRCASVDLSLIVFSMSFVFVMVVVFRWMTRPTASASFTTPVERPFGFILIFADETRAHRQLLIIQCRRKSFGTTRNGEKTGPHFQSASLI